MRYTLSLGAFSVARAALLRGGAAGSGCAVLFQQCGGAGFDGPTSCCDGDCTVVSEYHCAYFLLSCLPKFGCCAAPAKEVPTKLSLGGYGAPQAEGETMKR